MILSNYSILGNTYLDILQGIIKNSFNWIFDLLDMKIVPQDKAGGGKSWWNPFQGNGGSANPPSTTDTVKHWPDKPMYKHDTLSKELPTGKSLDDILGQGN